MKTALGQWMTVLLTKKCRHEQRLSGPSSAQLAVHCRLFSPHSVSWFSLVTVFYLQPASAAAATLFCQFDITLWGLLLFTNCLLSAAGNASVSLQSLSCRRHLAHCPLLLTVVCLMLLCSLLQLSSFCSRSCLSHAHQQQHAQQQQHTLTA